MSSSSIPQPTVHGAPMESEHFSPYRSDGKLYGFVCVVTGATQPIGRAIVHELAAHGAAYIYACSPDPETHPTYTALTATLAATHPHTKLIPYPAHDASAEQATLTLIDDVLNATGRLDVWATSPPGTEALGPPSVADTGPDELRRCFEANAAAPFWALKYAAPAMRKTTTGGGEGGRYEGAVPKGVAWGSVVVVGSVASATGGCWGAAFTMGCHAALGVVRAGVASLKGTGVRINYVSPGQIDMGIDLKGFDMRGISSQQLPPSSLQSEKAQKEHIGLERAGLPQEVAKVVGFLASGFSSYITGANLVVDGGATTMNPLTVPI